MTGTDSIGEGPDVATRLERAADRLAAAESSLEDVGESAAREAADAYRRATSLLDGYADEAVGTGRETFRSYVELEARFEQLVSSLPDDLAGRAAFEDAHEAIDKRRLDERDFERAMEALEPAAHFADLLEEREAAATRYREVRRRARERLAEVEDEIASRELLAELATVDLGEIDRRLVEPIEAYNEAVLEGFEAYRSETSAREVFTLLERSRLYPFVPFEQPPAELYEYVRSADVGEASIPQLLEYADYSRSKLDHYVEDPDAFKRRVATERTFLRELDGTPLTVDVPPPDAGVLRTRVEELVPFVDRIAGDVAVERLRTVRSLARSEDYGRLRGHAEAAAGLSEEERRRLEAGEDPDDGLTALRTERDRLEAALSR